LTGFVIPECLRDRQSLLEIEHLGEFDEQSGGGGCSVHSATASPSGTGARRLAFGGASEVAYGGDEARLDPARTSIAGSGEEGQGLARILVQDAAAAELDAADSGRDGALAFCNQHRLDHLAGGHIADHREGADRRDRSVQ
jgi:hypothetical protein